nr:hypothetical protein [Tanacetum cinerariifolium]
MKSSTTNVETLINDEVFHETNLNKKMTDKYCPGGEIKKLEVELWNLKVKGTDVCAPKCHKYNRVGHLAHDCRSTTNANTANNQRATRAGKKPTFFECGARGHFKRECIKLKNNNRDNQSGNGNASAKKSKAAYWLQRQWDLLTLYFADSWCYIGVIEVYGSKEEEEREYENFEIKVEQETLGKRADVAELERISLRARVRLLEISESRFRDTLRDKREAHARIERHLRFISEELRQSRMSHHVDRESFRRLETFMIRHHEYRP